MRFSGYIYPVYQKYLDWFMFVSMLAFCVFGVAMVLKHKSAASAVILLEGMVLFVAICVAIYRRKKDQFQRRD
jgi:hypothetical protein